MRNESQPPAAWPKACLLAWLAAASSGLAQGSPVPVKEAGGPAVDCSSGACEVQAGDTITWTVTIVNEWGVPVPFGFHDAPSSDPCPDESAPADALVFEDADLDGTCNEQVSVSGATGFVVDCDPAAQSLDVTGLVVDAFSSCTVTFVTRVAPTAPEGSIACNMGHVTDGAGAPLSDTGPPGSVTPACTCVTILAAPPPDLVVVKTATLERDTDGSGGLSSGDDIRWYIAVQNVGPRTVIGARFIDALLSCNRGFSGSVEFLQTDDASDVDPGTDASVPPSPPGSVGGTVQVDGLGGPNGLLPMETVTFEHVTTVDGVTTCCNQAFVDPGGGAAPIASDDPQTPALAFDSTCPVRQASTGSLSKSERLVDVNLDGILGPGDRVEYELTFTNVGTGPLTGVVVTDPSPPCVELDMASVAIEPPALGTDRSSGTTVSVGLVSPFDAGESVIVTFAGTILAAGSCCNQATWRAIEARGGTSDRDAGDMRPGEATCHETQAEPGDPLEMSLVKTLLEGACVAPGAFAHYRLTVRNIGTAPIPSFRLEDGLDGSLYWNPIADPPLDIDPTRDLDGDGVDDFLVYLDDSRVLAVGEFREYTYQAQVPCTLSGTTTNTAMLTFDGTSGVRRRSATSAATWGVPNLAVSENEFTWDDLDADGRVDAGETIHFTVTVRNAAAMGQCDARDVVVSEVLDSRFDPASVVVMDGGTWTPGTRTLRWTGVGAPGLALVAPGGEIPLRFDVLVDASVPEPDDIPNYVTVRAGNFIAGCPLLSPLEWYLWVAQPVPYGDLVVPPTFNLLRNDFVSCLPGAFATMRGDPAGDPVILRPAADECSEPPAINPVHAQTDVIPDPVSPHVFTADAGPGTESCPQAASGDGRVLVFYEIEDTCVESLRVRKLGMDVEVAW